MSRDKRWRLQSVLEKAESTLQSWGPRQHDLVRFNPERGTQEVLVRDTEQLADSDGELRRFLPRIVVDRVLSGQLGPAAAGEGGPGQ